MQGVASGQLRLSVVLPITLVAAGSLQLPAAESSATLRSCVGLLRNPFMLAMTCAIFLCVGAEVSISAGIPLFLRFLPPLWIGCPSAVTKSQGCR